MKSFSVGAVGKHEIFMDFPGEIVVSVGRTINITYCLRPAVRAWVNRAVDKMLQFPSKMSMLSSPSINLYELIMDVLS